MRRRMMMGLALLAFSTAVLGGSGGEITIQGQASDQHGKMYDLGDLSRGPLVVDFAASWCEPCYKALPKLEALAVEHPEVRFVVVSVDEKQAGRDRLVRDLDLTLPVLWDAGQKIVEEFSPEGFPATYVVDQGKVIYQHSGSDAAGWRDLIDVLREVREDDQSR